MSSCPICFEALSCKIKAKPDNCEHVFCLPCLERWAKQAGYCPVERTRFKKILNLETGAFIQIKSHKRKRKRRGAVYDFTNQCEICSGGDSVMLVLCDSCDLAYHTHCLKPPLESIPAGSWYCPTCISIEEKLKKKNGITKEVEADMGGVVGKLLHKTEHKKKLMNKNESIPKTKELNNSTPVIKNDNLLACYVDVISNFEDMIVKKKECKDASSSSKYLDSTIQDKMVTKFDTTGEISHVINSKFLNYKTFATNTYIKTKKSYSKTNSTTADMCLNESSGSSDINLQNFTLSSESLNVGAFYDDSDDDQSNIEKQINQFNSDFDYSQIKLFSETSSLLSDEFLENSTVPEKMPILDKVVEETSRRKSLDNMPAIDTDAELTSIRKLRSIREDAEKFFDNASYVEDSSSSCIKNANFKRSSQHSVPFRTLEKSSCDKNKPSKDSSFLTPSIMNPPVRKRGRPRKEDQPKKDRLKATITQLLETCVNNEEIKYDSPNFQPRVVLTRINDVSAFKSLTKVTHNGSLSSDADEESGINPYHFNEKGDCSLDIQNEKSLLSDQEKESKSNYKTSVSLNENKRDFSDTENENSFTSDEESRYNNKTPSSLSENEMNFSDTQNENSFISDEEEETDYNNNENSAFSSENVESVINNQNKTAPAPLDFDINLAVINPDGSIFVPKSTLKHTETNPQSSKAALSAQSELNNCDSEFSNMEYFDEKEILSEKTQSSLSENEMNFSDVQSENSFAYDEEEETDYNENSDFSHENMESFVNNQNKPAPLSLNDLNLAVIKPDGSIFIPKSTLKPAETDSRISKDTLSAQSDLNQCTVNRDSQFSNQSVNVDYSDENESLTEDEIISVTDLTSRNQFMQLNNKSSATSTGSSQAEQSQYNYKSVSSDYVIENKELEQGSFCEDDIEIINIFEKPAADFKPSYNYPQFTSCQSTPAISATYVQNSQKCDTDIGNIIEFEESQYLQIKSDGMYLFNQ